MFFQYLISKWTYLKYFEIFKMAAILRLRCVIEPEVVPEFELYTKIGYAIPYVDFVRRSSLNINGVMAISKFDLLFYLVT